MAISYIGGLTGSAVGSTSVGITFDLTTIGTLLEGDIVRVAVATGSSSNRTIGVSTSGYTALADLYSNDTVDTNLWVGYKRMGATPDATLVVLPSGNASDALTANVRVYRGVDATTAIDVAVQTATGINTGIPSPPSITPATSGAWVDVIGAGGGIDTTFSSSGLTAFQSVTGVDSNRSTLGSGYSEWVSGTYSPATFSIADPGDDSSFQSYAAVTIAFRPAAAPSFSDTVGASAGTSAVSGTAASVASTVGTSAGVATVSGIASAIAATAGAAAGAATISGVAAAIASAVGTASGAATVAGVGAALADTVGAASGTTTASATVDVIASTVGTAAGSSVISGVGAAIAATIGTAAGIGTASGIAASIAETVGTSAGIATVVGVAAIAGGYSRSALPSASLNAATVTAENGGTVQAANGGSVTARNGGTVTARNSGTII